MKNISFALTTAQFLDGSKTVTRRLGWMKARARDVLCAVEKSQGLKKGEKVKRLGPIRVKDARRERLDAITQADCILEGFPEYDPYQFVYFFCEHNGCTPETLVTRIEFERLT